jgi:hypothetical protein
MKLGPNFLGQQDLRVPRVRPAEVESAVPDSSIQKVLILSIRLLRPNRKHLGRSLLPRFLYFAGRGGCLGQLVQRNIAWNGVVGREVRKIREGVTHRRRGEIALIHWRQAEDLFNGADHINLSEGEAPAEPNREPRINANVDSGIPWLAAIRGF